MGVDLCVWHADRVAAVLGDFLASGGLIVDEGTLLFSALSEMVAQRVDFFDAYLAAKARHSPSAVATFNRDFDRLGVERVALEG